MTRAGEYFVIGVLIADAAMFLWFWLRDRSR